MSGEATWWVAVRIPTGLGSWKCNQDEAGRVGLTTEADKSILGGGLLMFTLMSGALAATAPEQPGRMQAGTGAAAGTMNLAAQHKNKVGAR